MLLYMDGFDTYSSVGDLLQSYYYNNNMMLLTSNGRFGQGCIYLNTAGSSIKWYSNKLLTEIWVGFAYKLISTNLGSGGPILSFLSPSGVEASIYITPSTGYWWAARGDNTTNLGGGTYSSMSVNSYHWVDIHYLLSNSTGVIEVWVDNTQVINVSNVNTTQNNVSNFSILNLGANNSITAYGYIDDLYVLDTTGSYNNTRLGDSRIETLVPKSDTGLNNGTPSTGTTHYNLVNKLPYASNANVLLGTTSGQEELYNMTQLAIIPPSIQAVKVKAITQQISSGINNVNTIVVSNNIQNSGNSSITSTNKKQIYNIFETDPNTLNAWTYSNINAMSCGIVIN